MSKNIEELRDLSTLELLDSANDFLQMALYKVGLYSENITTDDVEFHDVATLVNDLYEVGNSLSDATELASSIGDL